MSDVLTKVVGRVDALDGACQRLEAEQEKAGAEVQALGRGMAKILQQLQGQRDPKGQPDWIAVTDPDEAADMLARAVEWADRHLAYLGANVAPCWPWHPPVVVRVIALSEQYRAAYGKGKPTDVLDFLTRWLPGATSPAALGSAGACMTSTHIDGDGGHWTTDRTMLDDLARWWATADRAGTAPGMTAR